MGNQSELYKIFALFDDSTIRVYQAFKDAIASEAVQKGTFGAHFKLGRMTWIKPSFLWMMYRSGWATKEGQTRILAMDIKRAGFELIVKSAVASSYSEEIYGTHENWKELLAKSGARSQWDPDRDIHGAPQERRAIQLGIKGEFVRQYVYEWIVKITDITQYIVDMRTAIITKTFGERMLPIEREFLF